MTRAQTPVSAARRRSLPTTGVAVLAATVALALVACGGSSSPLSTATSGGSTATSGASGSGGSTSATAIKVGAADFSESELLADIYAGALTAKGINATTSGRIGSRETYLTGLTDGSIHLIPEYTGALALYYDKSFAETDPQKVYDGLKAVLPSTLTVLAKSAAEDNDSITVTKAFADEKKVTKVSDLTALAGDLSLAAPPEFASRAQGIPGLKKSYGITFKTFRPLKGQAIVQALKNGQVEAANIFTTDPAIAANNFVVLEDDKKLFGSQNIVPLIAKSAVTAEVSAALDAVSAKLTTDGLRDMLTKVDVDHQDATTVAAEWLKANALG